LDDGRDELDHNPGGVKRRPKFDGLEGDHMNPHTVAANCQTEVRVLIFWALAIARAIGLNLEFL
jgi:hypothetical protein